MITKDRIDTEAGHTDWEVMSDMIGVDEEGNELWSKEFVRINFVFVKPEFRGQGYARKMLTDAITQIHKELPGMEIKIVCCPQEDGMDFDRLYAFYSSLDVSEVIAD